MEGQSNLPASAIFLKSFSLKYPICPHAIFEGSVFQTLSSAIPMPTSRKSVSLVLPFYVLFFYIWLCWVFSAAQAFSSYGTWGLCSSCRVLASRCCGFSCCVPQALGAQGSVAAACGLRSCGSWA